MPTVVYDGPLPTRRVGFGMLVRGQPQEVSQSLLDTYRTQLLNCRILDEDEDEDDGDGGIPDNGWTRVNIIDWLKGNDVRTRAGLTKAQLLSRVDEYLNPTVEEETVEEEVESTEENNSGEDLGEDIQE
jgi:hypothetical protein